MRLPAFDYDTAAFDVGRFGRAKVVVDASFFIVAFALTYQFWSRPSMSNLLLTVFGIAAIFGSILIHEFAHAVFARRYRIPVTLIEIHVFGGTVHFGWRPAKLSQDVALTFAGPASNLILAAVCFVLLMPFAATTAVSPLAVVGSGFDVIAFVRRALTFAMYVNLGLGLVNLLPAFPLDGGWIAYRTLTHRFGQRNAGMIVGSLGIVLAAFSGLVFLASLFAGMAIYSPPDFRSNLDALQAARRGEPVPV